MKKIIHTMFQKINLRRREGQIMLVSVLMLSGVILSTTAVAGLLMVYQVRSSNDSVNSAKAFFAADAGIEEASWCYFKANPPCYDNPPRIQFADPSVSVQTSSTFTTVLDIVSRGFAAGGNVERVLETVFE